MKRVTTASLVSVEPTDEFRKAADRAKSEDEGMVRKTFTLRKSDVDRINALARQLSEEERRQVNASEALRRLIERNMP